MEQEPGKQPRSGNKISIVVIGSVALYYRHRKYAQHDPNYPWDKECDLKCIFAAAKRDGWTVEAVAGTFWFSKPSPLGTVIVKVNENNYLTGGESNVGESLAKHPMLDWVMGKLGRNKQ